MNKMKIHRNFLIRFFRSLAAMTIRIERFYRQHPDALMQLHMERMKYMMFFGMLLILVSCGSTKKVTEKVTEKKQTNTEVSKQTEAVDSGTRTENTAFKADSTVNRTQELIEKLTAEWEARLRTFDTSQPTDPSTGTPPIASELVIVNRNATDRKLTETVNTNTTQSAEIDIKTEWRNTAKQWLDSAMQANSRTITNTTTETKPAGWPWWAWLLTGAALTAFVYLVIRYGWWRKLGWLLSVVR